MVVCKFFLQGFCKFGENCRYQHYEDNRSNSQIANYRSHNRSWQSPSYVPAQGGRASGQVNTYQRPPQTAPGHLNPLDLCSAIKDDVTAMEEGGQWPLSCYTPLKDIGSFPGFHDISMEEVRYEAYQAQSSGTFDQYVKKMGNLIQATRMKWAMLKNPTGQVMNVIEKMARGQIGETPVHLESSFSLNANNPLQPTIPFSQNVNTAFPTGGGSQSSAASTFRFTLPSSDSTYVSSTSFPPSTFGQGGTMMFGVNNATADIASQSIPTAAMGGETPHTTTGFFGGQSVFGTTPQAEVSNIWSRNPGTLQNNIQPAFADAGVYTNLADLNEAEKKEFTAMTFTLGSIPLRPPPCELCS